MLPQNVKLESLTTKAEETEEGTLVTYELSNQVVGSAVMTDENYAVFQEKRGVNTDNGQDNSVRDEDSVITVSRPAEKKEPTDKIEQQGSGTRFVMYLTMGILGILILIGIVLIFVGAGKKKKKRRH